MAHPPQFVDNETIVISREGIWMANGQEVTHSTTLQAFTQNLFQDAEGYYIAIGRETKRIQVEDTAWFVHGLEGDPESGYTLLLSDGTKVGLDPGKLKYRPGRLTCEVVTRIGPQEAKFLRAPYFDLMRYLQEDEKSYFLNFAGSRVDLAKK